jgi:exonuclease III
MFLSECWIENDFALQVDGYTSYIYPRMKTSTKNGGGCIVLVKDTFVSYVTVIELVSDSIVWCKIDKSCVECDEDIYCAFIYIPPSSSNYYVTYDCDLFHELEAKIAKYILLGKVFIIGDFNSRTKQYPDFIPNDYLHDSVSHMFTYIMDEEMHERVNPDTGRNDFGPRLLNLCKSTGIRIVNGRHKDGLANDYTYHGPRGLSVIDYLLSTPDMFKYFVKFMIADFNEYSDHAPLHLELKIKYTRELCDGETQYCGAKRNVYRWNPEYSEQCREAVRVNLDTLDFDVDSIVSQDSMNTCVDSFSKCLHDVMLPFVNGGSRCSVPTTRHSGKIPKVQARQDDKPWFDADLKACYSQYISALKVFNKEKTSENHDILMQKKKRYKSTHNTRKQSYMRTEGNMLSQLKRNNPRQFYAKFAKKTSKCSVPLQKLFEHFKDLASENQQDIDVNNSVGDSNDTNDTVFEELDKQIDADEICRAIHGLKTCKSHAEDCILNEYLIEFKDMLLPRLCRLFNCILDTGLFPTSWSSATIVPILKKGDASNPNYYRGISIVSNLGKLFTSILNRRLLEWSGENDVITDAQFGFKPGYSTTDAIFALHSIISNSLSSKKRLYCAFIDFQKAFDSVDRTKLWYKLSAVGIRGKLLNIIKSMYTNIRACTTSNGYRSEYFTSNLGLLQGEVLSPI